VRVFAEWRRSAARRVREFYEGPGPPADAFLYARATTVPWVWCRLGDIARFLLILCLPATPNLRSTRWPSCPVHTPHALLAEMRVRARISVSQTVLSTLSAHARYGSMQLDEPARICLLFCTLTLIVVSSCEQSLPISIPASRALVRLAETAPTEERTPPDYGY
jgi:hypothetical protein